MFVESFELSEETKMRGKYVGLQGIELDRSYCLNTKIQIQRRRLASASQQYLNKHTERRLDTLLAKDSRVKP